MLTVVCPCDASDSEKHTLPDKRKSHALLVSLRKQIVEKQIMLTINLTPAAVGTTSGKPHRSLYI